MTNRKERIDEWLNGRDPVQLSALEIQAMRSERLICGYARPNANYAPCMKAPKGGADRCGTHDRKGNALKGPDHPNFRHGRYAVAFKGELKKKFATLLSDQDPFDLLPELAAQRVLFQTYVERFEPGVRLTRDNIFDLMLWAEKIVKTATSIIRARNETALTIAELQFLRIGITEAINEFIEDPERRLAFIDRVAELVPIGNQGIGPGGGDFTSLPG